ncbi:IclR family transcriptional regulator [Shouchella clausii]|jgi:IclR family transcriptional regulator, KDG regulon repressor|uniref:IclR family transcriptional regulator n=1 Tax=Shouchella clausii TaxID=79880 RepID=UPI000BA7DB5E|nr:IclR family transcriptional regulator [Shouchella clausii]SPT78596.1 IclR family transcriptional regulator [Niallia circulans]MCM3550990.1 IclR family transcriptional regulator [Shouchella clausii]MCY1104192.1 IclR family transcriptional regulator [Shouchella clausii]PAD08909.1 IclR family transcriptional regulator [Shouchella clausii]PAD15301.1 IclR family transcriptional regulator [Shouchella clausii]
MSNVQSVERALSILNLLSKYPKGIKLTDLANRLKLSKATAHRLLATLIDLNYVRQDRETEKYKLGYQIVSMATYFLEGHDLISTARPHLTELSEQANETVHLCIEDNGMVLYIDKIESTQPIAMYSRIGSKAPMYCTAVGKVMLAGMEQQKCEELAASFDYQKMTPYTIDNPNKLLQEIAKVKRQGYAIDNQEITEGIRCIACPIIDYTDKTIASFSMSGPMNRLTNSDFEHTLIAKMLETSEAISRECGWPGEKNRVKNP